MLIEVDCFVGLTDAGVSAEADESLIGCESVSK